MKCRIVEYTNVDGRISYIIEQRHFLFRWWWVPAWVNNDVSTIDEFDTLEEAQKNVRYFDSSKPSKKVIAYYQ